MSKVLIYPDGVAAEPRRTTLRQAILMVGGSTVGTLLLLELVLRFLPVQNLPFATPVNEQNPILRFEPHREFTYSQGPFLAMANRGRTNNYGFVSNQDYDRANRSPLLAFIGDSQIEALMVPAESTVVGRTQAALGSSARAYSFAISGAPLSQYLAYAAYARKTFAPSAFVVAIIENDFDQSLLASKARTGFHQFRRDATGLRLVRLDRGVASRRTRIVLESALARYLLLNVGLVRGRNAFRAQPTDQLPPRHRDPTSPSNRRMLEESKRAVDVFLDSLPVAAGLPANRILLLIDGIRPELYESGGLERVRHSYASVMRDYFIRVARQRGYEVADLQPRFVAHFQREHKRFDFSHDWHWNSLAHSLAFDVVRESGVFRGVRRHK